MRCSQQMIDAAAATGPEREEPIADPRRRGRAREYARIRRRLLVVDLALTAALLLILMLSGASLWLRAALEGTLPAAFGETAAYLVTVVAYVAVLTLGAAVV